MQHILNKPLVKPKYAQVEIYFCFWNRTKFLYSISFNVRSQTHFLMIFLSAAWVDQPVYDFLPPNSSLIGRSGVSYLGNKLLWPGSNGRYNGAAFNDLPLCVQFLTQENSS